MAYGLKQLVEFSERGPVLAAQRAVIVRKGAVGQACRLQNSFGLIYGKHVEALECRFRLVEHLHEGLGAEEEYAAFIFKFLHISDRASVSYDMEEVPACL